MCTVRKPSLPAPTSLCDGELYLPALSLVLGCFVISPDSPAVSNTGAGPGTAGVPLTPSAHAGSVNPYQSRTPCLIFVICHFSLLSYCYRL